MPENSSSEQQGVVFPFSKCHKLETAGEIREKEKGMNQKKKKGNSERKK